MRELNGIPDGHCASAQRTKATYTGGAGVLAATGLHIGWLILTATVLIVCGLTVLRLAFTSSKGLQ